MVDHGLAHGGLQELEQPDGTALSDGFVRFTPRNPVEADTSTGCFEAIIVPGISLIVASFYKKEEQPPRNALVFAAASSVINGFLSWAIGHIDGHLAIWQYLFLIIGEHDSVFAKIRQC